MGFFCDRVLSFAFFFFFLVPVSVLLCLADEPCCLSSAAGLLVQGSWFGLLQETCDVPPACLPRLCRRSFLTCVRVSSGAPCQPYVDGRGLAWHARVGSGNNRAILRGEIFLKKVPRRFQGFRSRQTRLLLLVVPAFASHASHAQITSVESEKLGRRRGAACGRETRL